MGCKYICTVPVQFRDVDNTKIINAKVGDIVDVAFVDLPLREEGKAYVYFQEQSPEDKNIAHSLSVDVFSFCFERSV